MKLTFFGSTGRLFLDGGVLLLESREDEILVEAIVIDREQTMDVCRMQISRPAQSEARQAKLVDCALAKLLC